jgi:hypothetical protein
MKSVKIFTLKDGTVIPTSNRGTTGYLGATFSDRWAMSDYDKLFIAAMSRPTDLGLEALLPAPHATSLHMGKYADAREAAYVVALYKEDPVPVLELLNEQIALNGANSGLPQDIFPADLYDLPVFFSHSDGVKAIKRRKRLGNRKRTGNRAAKIAARAAAKAEALRKDEARAKQLPNATEIRRNLVAMDGPTVFATLSSEAKADIQNLTWPEWRAKHLVTA